MFGWAKELKKGGLIGQLWSFLFFIIDAWSGASVVSKAFRVGVEGVGICVLVGEYGTATYAVWRNDSVGRMDMIMAKRKY